MPNIKEVWKDPVWSKIIAAAILAIGTGILATLRGWWPAVGGFVVRAWSWLGESSAHPNWLLSILWLSFGSLLLFAMLIAVFNLRSQKSSRPRTWRDYKTDQFFGLQWVWRNDSTGSIYGIFALCLDCKAQVLAKHRGGYPVSRTAYYCDVCGTDKVTLDGDEHEIEKKVTIRVQKNMRTGEWAGPQTS